MLFQVKSGAIFNESKWEEFFHSTNSCFLKWLSMIQISQQTTPVQIVELLTLIRSSYIPITSIRPLSDIELQENDQISD